VENVGEPSSYPGFLLEADCSPGLMSLELAWRGHKVPGIDRFPEMLKQTRKKQMGNLDNRGEKKIQGLLKTTGFRLEWLHKSWRGNSHILLYEGKER
jgi:hypothetical protein